MRGLFYLSIFLVTIYTVFFLLGLGTVHAYLDSPKFCSSCHVMEKEYQGYLKKPHSGKVSCGGCHLPAGFPRYGIEKTYSGIRDFLSFSYRTYPDVIKISARSQKIVEENCLRCHQGATEKLLGVAQRCTFCHRQVFH
ncbi:cytochrome c nitrite reductase small subunit [Carboxydothermus pertinax]|uniref:cytochrome c nitrite reductase small subunit n=1 Tax=Carboxydothermus pertinax TaxID=870242 RepID=UPI00096A75F7|nr:cytochrome c nitrite reductase small subunit [Carboxydothermus pertinax]